MCNSVRENGEPRNWDELCEECKQFYLSQVECSDGFMRKLTAVQLYIATEHPEHVLSIPVIL